MENKMNIPESFKTGAVMDLLKDATLVREDAETIADAKTSKYMNKESAGMDLNEQIKYEQLRKTRPIVREYKKIGRNAPCPCGSGKKYKNCCLNSGKYEQYHELSVVEMGDVKANRAHIGSFTKTA